MKILLNAVVCVFLDENGGKSGVWCNCVHLSFHKTPKSPPFRDEKILNN